MAPLAEGTYLHSCIFKQLLQFASSMPPWTVRPGWPICFRFGLLLTMISASLWAQIRLFSALQGRHLGLKTAF